ncbi:MAG: Lrp/AsnC ligand binding domain-containing protein [Acidimicrobiales bacterium]|jgi:DNA-binding Lrp family transcriptional regulator
MVEAVVLVNAAPARLATLGRELADVAGVAAAYSVAGDEDFVVIVRVVNHEDLADVVTKRIAVLEGITGLRTLIAFRSFGNEDERYF